VQLFADPLPRHARLRPQPPRSVVKDFDPFEDCRAWRKSADESSRVELASAFFIAHVFGKALA
jgi:hypothetical protein